MDEGFGRLTSRDRSPNDKAWQLLIRVPSTAIEYAQARQHAATLEATAKYWANVERVLQEAIEDGDLP